jgi:hypothetical protein
MPDMPSARLMPNPYQPRQFAAPFGYNYFSIVIYTIFKN